MLPRAQRLRTDRDYEAVFRRSRMVRNTHLTVRVAQGAGPADRYGFVVSTKVSKRATVRNLIKRRLRAASRELVLPPHAPIDVAVTAQQASTTTPYPKLHHELQQLISSVLHAPSRR